MEAALAAEVLAAVRQVAAALPAVGRFLKSGITKRSRQYMENRGENHWEVKLFFVMVVGIL